MFDQTAPAMVALRLSSFAIYAVACALNWTWQARGIYGAITAGLADGGLTYWHGLLLPYAAGLCLVAYDDIVLMRWLLWPTKRPGRKQQPEKKAE